MTDISPSDVEIRVDHYDEIVGNLENTRRALGLSPVYGIDTQKVDRSPNETPDTFLRMSVTEYRFLRDVLELTHGKVLVQKAAFPGVFDMAVSVVRESTLTLDVDRPMQQFSAMQDERKKWAAYAHLLRQGLKTLECCNISTFNRRFKVINQFNPDHGQPKPAVLG